MNEKINMVKRIEIHLLTDLSEISANNFLSRKEYD